MNRLLTDYELSKLNSMEGIIELLCDIPNFKEDMYDELPDDKRILVDNLLSIDLVTKLILVGPDASLDLFFAFSTTFL